MCALYCTLQCYGTQPHAYCAALHTVELARFWRTDGQKTEQVCVYTVHVYMCT